LFQVQIELLPLLMVLLLDQVEYGSLMVEFVLVTPMDLAVVHAKSELGVAT